MKNACYSHNISIGYRGCRRRAYRFDDGTATHKRCRAVNSSNVPSGIRMWSDERRIEKKIWIKKKQWTQTRTHYIYVLCMNKLDDTPSLLTYFAHNNNSSIDHCAPANIPCVNTLNTEHIKYIFTNNRRPSSMMFPHRLWTNGGNGRPEEQCATISAQKRNIPPVITDITLNDANIN